MFNGVPPKSHLSSHMEPPLVKWPGLIKPGLTLYDDLDCIWMIYLALSEKNGIPQSLANDS